MMKEPTASARTGKRSSVPVARLVRYAAGLTAALVMLHAVPMPAHAAPSTPFVIPGCASTAAPQGGGVLAAAVPIADPAVAAPAASAKSAVMIDGDTGRVLYDVRAHQRRAPASTTKIMTAILAIENGDFDRVITSDIDATRMIGSSVMGLRPGVPVTERDLLFGLMLPSGNDAAIALAKTIDSTVPAFVERMNAKAAELGLSDTHFVNPHGLDSRAHYSSAYDLAQLARYAMKNPAFAGLVSTRDWDLSPPLDYTLHNGNSLLGTYPGADGVKIGWTDRAGWTFVASATRDGHRLIVALLDTADRDGDAAALFDWGWASHRWASVNPAAEQTLLLARRLGFRVPVLGALTRCG